MTAVVSWRRASSRSHQLRSYLFRPRNTEWYTENTADQFSGCSEMVHGRPENAPRLPRPCARRACTGAWPSWARRSEASCCRAGTPTMRRTGRSATRPPLSSMRGVSPSASTWCEPTAWSRWCSAGIAASWWRRAWRCGARRAGTGLSPYFSPAGTVHAGCRDDEHLREATARLGAVLPASQIRLQGVERAARTILAVAGRAGLDGYWLHLGPSPRRHPRQRLLLARPRPSVNDGPARVAR
jgi:hypothetical protein